jgi:hypothetical protein
LGGELATIPALRVDALDEQPDGEGELADEDGGRDGDEDPAAPRRSDDEGEGVRDVPDAGELIEPADQAGQLPRLADEIAGDEEEAAGEQQARAEAVGVRVPTSAPAPRAARG